MSCKRTISGTVRHAPIVIIDPDEGTELALHWALKAANDSCMVLNTHTEPWDLIYIGALQHHLMLVLTFIRSRPSTTAKDIVENLCLKPGDINRRLKDLYIAGMVNRKPSTNGGGYLAYTYHFVHPYLLQNPTAIASSLPFHLYVEPTRRVRIAKTLA